MAIGPVSRKTSMNLAMRKVVQKYKGCKACPLYKKAKSYVFFRGTSPCEVLFIGEAPGADEDMVGQPFIGKSGDLLDRWIAESIDATLQMILKTLDGGIRYANGHAYSYGIINQVLCRPVDADGGNGVPKKEEVAACSPRLAEQVKACNPSLIVFLGREAARNIILPESLASIPRVELQHPAYVLRNGGVGTLTYDQNLLKLVNGIEAHLYGQEESIPPVSPKASRKKVVHKKVSVKVAKKVHKKAFSRPVKRSKKA